MSTPCATAARTACVAALVCLVACGEPTAFVSEHVRIVVTSDLPTDAEVQQVGQGAEARFDAIAEMVGNARMPSSPITIVMGGPVTADSIPRLDGNGRILLYRYPDWLGGYLSPLTHELVHAVRFEFWHDVQSSSWPTFGFFEEGFAEFVAQTFDPTSPGFPFFGYPEEIVVGYWVTSGLAIPPAVLRQRHHALNLPCQNQSYTQRASWFRYLDETYGRAATLAVAYSARDVTDAVALSLVGVDLPAIDAGWEASARQRYATYPNASTLAAEYRTLVPDYVVCLAGRDY